MKSFWAGGFLYNPKTRSVLLHERDDKATFNPDKWAFFGGTREGEESPEETFQREFKEELSIDIPKNDIKVLCEYFNEELKTYRYVFYSESDLKKSEMDLGEGKDFDWIPLDGVFGYDLTEKTERDLRYFLEKNNS